MTDSVTDDSPDFLRQILGPADYRIFAGPDWPSLEDIILGKEITNTAIDQEVRDFVRKMRENYIAHVKHGDVLAVANQQRQKHVFSTKNYAGPHCSVPWNTMGVNKNGDVFICSSPSWIPKFVGNLLRADDLFSVLNSDLAIAIRNEIAENRYTFCNHRICSFFSTIPRDQYQISQALLDPPLPQSISHLKINRVPQNLIFDFDYTCNFRCPSCRTEIINHNNHHVIRSVNNRIVDRIKQLVIDIIGHNLVKIRWCGGEPFISDVYVDLMTYIIQTKKANIRHIIQTNGSYLIKKADLVQSLLPNMEEIRVSFDAATAETYHKVRINGRWSQLLENVRWLRETIDQTAPNCRLSADFVVQLQNYKEIGLMVDLAKELGIDQINWQNMWNWGTWPQEEFDRQNVYDRDHPLYDDLCSMFKQANQPMSLI